MQTLKLTLAACISLSTWSAQAQGIRFTKALNWEQVKAQAKAENKYILMDCFATWCAPCKAMSQNVFPRQEVGDFINERFIAVKVQMDSTQQDDETVRSWRADARTIAAQYKIAGYPTVFYFSPDGMLVHRTFGNQDPQGFLNDARTALEPQRLQLHAMIAEYRNGKRDYAVLPMLAKAARDLVGDKDLANAMARDYKQHYLDKLSEDELCTHANIDFINQNGGIGLVTSGDRFFKLCYEQPERVDKVMNFPGFSKFYTTRVVSKEEILSKLPASENPDWQKMEAAVRKKYEKVDAAKLVNDEKLGYYRRKEDWKKYAAIKDELIRKYPPKTTEGLDGDSWQLNSAAWDVFLSCKDKSVLESALRWSELSIQLEEPQPNIQFLDTKANILYKLGRVKEGIELEEKAIQTSLDIAKKNGGEPPFLQDYKDIVEKMRKGEPTWPVK